MSKLRSVWGLSVVGVVLVGAVAVAFGLGRLLESGDECTVAPHRGNPPPPALDERVELGANPSAQLAIEFGTGRNAKDDAIPNDALLRVVSGAPPPRVDLLVLPLERGNDTIPAVSARAELFGGAYRVIACVDPGSAPPGAYTSSVRFPDGFGAEPVQLHATLKSRGADVIGIPLAAGALVVGTAVANYAASRKNWAASLLTAAGLVSALYVATILDDATFGKGLGWYAYVTFFLNATTAAAGGSTAATAGARVAARKE